jgi:hypothetical protein
VVVNPIEAARVLTLLLLDGASALGPFGAYLTDRFGPQGAVTLLLVTLGAWVVGPLALAAVATGRRDV